MDPLAHICFEDNNSHMCFEVNGILLYRVVLKVCEHTDHQSKVHRSFATKAHFTQVKRIQLESCLLHEKEQKETV